MTYQHLYKIIRPSNQEKFYQAHSTDSVFIQTVPFAYHCPCDCLETSRISVFVISLDHIMAEVNITNIDPDTLSRMPSIATAVSAVFGLLAVIFLFRKRKSIKLTVKTLPRDAKYVLFIIFFLVICHNELYSLF